MPNAYEIPGDTLGVHVAGEDLSAKQYQFVNLETSGEWKVAGATSVAVAVLQNKPKSGVAASTLRSGVSLVKLGASGLAVGIPVKSGATGLAIAATSGQLAEGFLTVGGNTDALGSISLGKFTVP